MKHGYIDKYSNIESKIHLFDPRLKLIAAILFILCIIQTGIEGAYKLLIYFVLLLLFILKSKVPVRYIFLKSFIILPFVIMVVFFAFFSNIAPLFHQNKFINVSFIIVKAWLSFLTLIILSSTTKYQSILKGLDKLKTPKAIIMILNFMYRYIFVFIDEFERMNRARELKNYNKGKISQFKILGNMIAILYLRAYERAEKVYLSMVMRGFNGEIKTMDNISINLKELLLFISLSLFLLFIFCIKV